MRTIEFIPNGDLFETTITLDAVIYSLRLKKLKRVDRWNIEIRDADGVLLAASIRAVQRLNMLEGRTADGLPPGDLKFISRQRSSNPVATENIGTDSILKYISDAENLIFSATAALTARGFTAK